MKLHQGDFWTRRGLTLLWQPTLLSQVCQPREVVSMRQWLQWPNDAALPSNKGRALVVAGLDAVLDTLGDTADDWLKTEFKQAERRFQDATSTELALVFWLPDGLHRIKASMTDDRYQLALRPEGLVALQSIFGGAEKDLERIVAPGTKPADTEGNAWHGLYLRRNS